MAYQPQFEEIGKAVNSLNVFPDTIKEFTEMLKQRYRRKHSTNELVWIDELCGIYQDNCYNYVKFIKRVVATQFLAKCLSVEDDLQRRALIKELKANIQGANRRLDEFLGTTDRDNILAKVDGVLAEMEAVKAKKDKKSKYYFKFSEMLKGKIVSQVSEVFAKVISPLWDLVYTNAAEAVKSDYDHETLTGAVSNIVKFVPVMEKSMEENRSALQGIEAVLDVLQKEDKDELEKCLRRLYPVKNNVEKACDKIMEAVDALT